MYCKNCGAEISENSAFCPNCGAKVAVEQQPTNYEYNPYQQYSEPKRSGAKVWDVFAIIGFVVGIVSIASCWNPFGFSYSIYGIVLSALGKKSTSINHFGKAKTGLVLSIIATAISIIAYIIYLVLVYSGEFYYLFEDLYLYY